MVAKSLFEEIQSVAAFLQRRRGLIFFVFNLDSIFGSRGPDDPLYSKLVQQIDWIQKASLFRVALFAGRPVHMQRQEFRDFRLIFIGSAGYEIDSPELSWQFPGLSLVRQALENVMDVLRMEMTGSDLRYAPTYNGISIEMKLGDMELPQQNRITKLVQQTLGGTISPELTQTRTQITIGPRNMWNHGRAMENFLRLWPREKGEAPRLVYIGGDGSDETAYPIANRNGISVMIANGSKSASTARYFVSNGRELSKFLFWVQSL